MNTEQPKQQTAVEWLEQKLKNRYSLIHTQPFFEQAKQMFYEQIRHAWIDGYANHRDVLNHERIEKYYKSRYGK